MQGHPADAERLQSLRKLQCPSDAACLQDDGTLHSISGTEHNADANAEVACLHAASHSQHSCDKNQLHHLERHEQRPIRTWNQHPEDAERRDLSQEDEGKKFPNHNLHNHLNSSDKVKHPENSGKRDQNHNNEEKNLDNSGKRNQNPMDEEEHPDNSGRRHHQNPIDEEEHAQNPFGEVAQQAELDQRAATRLLADNFASCLAALLFSLTLGLALSPLSAAMAATGQSDTPLKALRRYVSTARHVLAWHLGDPADPTSRSGRSAAAVRRGHAAAAAAVAARAHKQEGPSVASFPASDMRTVQTAFVAYALLHRRMFGIRCCGEAQLAAYARHWHRIGCALGMAESDSALAGDLGRCRAACGDVQLRLVAALQRPPAQFRPLADALAGGVRLAACGLPVWSPAAVADVFLSDASGCPEAMRRRALAAVGHRPVTDTLLAAVLRWLLRLLAWTPRRLHRRLFRASCRRFGLQPPDWWLRECGGLC